MPSDIREAERAENCGKRALPEVNALFVTVDSLIAPRCTYVEGYSSNQPLSESGYADVPNATFVVRDGENNVIGRLRPDEMPADLEELHELIGNCTFIYTGKFDLADVMLIEGPRMQDGGFPVWREDTYDLDGITVLAELSLG